VDAASLCGKKEALQEERQSLPGLKCLITIPCFSILRQRVDAASLVGKKESLDGGLWRLLQQRGTEEAAAEAAAAQSGGGGGGASKAAGEAAQEDSLDAFMSGEWPNWCGLMWILNGCSRAGGAGGECRIDMIARNPSALRLGLGRQAEGMTKHCCLTTPAKLHAASTTKRL